MSCRCCKTKNVLPVPARNDLREKFNRIIMCVSLDFTCSIICVLEKRGVNHVFKRKQVVVILVYRRTDYCYPWAKFLKTRTVCATKAGTWWLSVKWCLQTSVKWFSLWTLEQFSHCSHSKCTLTHRRTHTHARTPQQYAFFICMNI